MFGGVRDAYVAQINPAGSTLTYAGYLGGDADDRGEGIAIGSDGGVFIAGQTTSTAATFPVTVGPDLTYNGGRDAFIAKIEITGPSITVEGIVNAATFVGGPIAPGEIISIFGVEIGPDPGVNSTFNDEGNVPTLLAGVQVLINGVPAPLYFVGENQVNCQVPYEVDGTEQVTVQVIFNGTASNIVTIDVAETAPGLFTLENGIGQVIAVLFPEGTLNTAENPVAPGQIVTLYGTGEGQTVPTGLTGVPVDVPLPIPIADVVVRIGGVEQDILYVGGAPGFAGLLQLNIEIVVGTPAGEAVPIVVTIGGVGSTGALAPGKGPLFDIDVVDDILGVTIAIVEDPNNQGPVANGQMVMTDEDVALAITLTGSDPEGDPLTFTITRAPANGAVSAPVSTRPGSADVTYTPVANFNGLDSFDFQVADPNGGSSMATVEIEVKPLPDAPVDNNDSANAVQDTALEIDVLRNDFDPDGDALTISAVGAAGNGSTTTNGSTVAYTPGSGFIGFDSFEYTISDENGKALDTATVSVQVTRAPVPENSDPTANPQSVMTNENVPLPILLSGSDPDGDTLTFTLLTAPANGTLGPINPQSRETAEVPYTPNTDYDGPDEFMFQVDDGEGGSDMAVVNITVKRISDLTITKTGPAMATLGGMVTFDVMVFNAGPSDATGITVVDQLPPELTFSAGGSSASCSAAGQTVTCMPIDLAVGVGVTLNVEATVSGGVPTQMVTNTATVDFPDDPTAPDMAGHTVELVSLPPMVGNPGAGLETVGNTRLDVSNPPAPLTAEEEALAAEIPEAAAAPKSHSGVPSVDVASNIQTLGNVTDPENDPLIFSVSAANASTGTFSITTALGGEFTYDPPAGCGLGPDTLTYTVSDGFNMVDGTLTINFVDCIWYVKNNHSSGGDGTSVNPFNKLSDGAGDANLDDGEDASSDGEDIFVLFGDGTTTNQDSGITLNNQQRLIGEGVELTARNPFTMPVGNEPGQSLFPAGNKPQIGSPGTSDVVIETAGEERTGMEVQGLVMTGGGSIGIEVLANSLTNAEVLIANNDFGNATEGPTDRGIAAINSDEGNLTLAINNNTFVNVGDAVDDFGVSVANSFTGRTFITSFSGNVLDGISSGIGVSGTGVSMTGVIFDANPSDPDFTGDTVPAGATSVGASGSPVGATGVILTNVEGDVDFGLASGVLDVFATDAGLQANGFGPLSAGGGMGFRISVPDGSTIAGNGAALAPLTEAPTTQPKLVTALGGAMDLDPLTAVFGTSGGAGVTLLGESVSFVQIQGDLFFNSTSVLSGGLSDVFLLTNSDASIDYDGTIVDDTGFGITISGNGTAANNDTVNFNGTVDLGMDAALTNAAVEMTANDPTFTVNFNAALNIDASGADGIVGTGSGTLATVAGSSINATDGAAINIDGDSNPNEIDFGPGSLNFDTITVNDTNPAAGFGINIVDFTGTANLGVVTLNTTDGVALRLSNGGTAKTLPGSTINATDGRAIEALNVDFGTGSLHFDSVSANSIALITPVTFLNASGRINIMGGSIAETSGNPTPAIKVEDTPSSLEFILHNTTLTGSVDDELRVVSDTGPLCVSMSGNTLDAGSGAIDFDQAPTGTISVVQGDAAILAAVNGIPPANVLESGTIGYGAGCLTGGGPFDNAPTAQNDAAMVDEDMTVSINVIDGSAGGLDSDPDAGDIISLRGIMTAPTMGTATITSPTNVLYDYTGAFLGLGNSFMDTFVYELTDKAGNIVMAQVTVTVNGVAVPPNTATNDSYQTAGNTLLEVASTTSFASTAKVLVNDNLCSNDTDGGGGLSLPRSRESLTATAWTPIWPPAALKSSPQTVARSP